jgi:ABC-type branched-subunit amino acid transport system substrate-binding protein
MPKLFISYDAKDRSFAQSVKAALTQAGIESAADEFDLSSEADFASAVRAEVRSADALLAILPGQAGYSRNVLVEIGMALGLGKKVIALAAPGSEPDASTVQALSDSYVADASTLEPPELGARIMEALTASVAA